MAKPLVMPKMGFDNEQSTIVRWLKQAGEPVSRGEKVAEVETEKAGIEIENFHDGVLHTVLAQEGQEVPVGQPIAVIADSADEVVDLAALDIAPPGAAAADEVAQPLAAPDAAAAAAGDGAVAAPAEAATPGRARASPLARRLAAEHSLDLTTIAGSGPEGRIERRDIEAAVAAPVAATGTEGQAFEDLEPSRMRQAIARAMNRSKPGAPHFYVTMPIDMGAALSLRCQLVGLAPDEVSRPSINDLVLAAVAQTLRQFPDLNAWFVEGKIRRFRRVNLGVAVALSDGLITPVIPDAETKSVYQLAAETKAVIERTRGGRNRPEDFNDVTFTVSNMGALSRDIEDFSAIINPPQAAILAVAAAIRQPVVRDDQIAIADVMRVTLSVDHRIGDGGSAAQFLIELKRLLEHPLLLLVG